MKHTYTIALAITLLIACAFAAPAFGQSATTASPSLLPAPREIVAVAGSEYNYSGSPKITMALGAFYPVTGASYAGVAVDLAFKKSQQPGITFRPEYLPRIFAINGHDFYGIVGLGAQFQASDPSLIVTNLKAALANVGTNVGYSAATGITTSFALGKTGLALSPVFRVVKGSLNDTTYVGGVVLGTKIRVSP